MSERTVTAGERAVDEQVTGIEALSALSRWPDDPPVGAGVRAVRPVRSASPPASHSVAPRGGSTAPSRAPVVALLHSRPLARLSLVLLSGGVSVLGGLSSPVGVGPAQAQGPLPVEGLTSPSGSPPPGEMDVVYPNRAVGTLGGGVSVGVGGGASWTTSLKAVPGVAGLEPSLTIGYGGGGYGGLGVGFSLSAGGAISRCRDTIGQDGRHEPIDWTVSDALCLGGDRLVAVTGAHGADGTEYRPQTAPTVRVVAHGASTAASASFDVYTPDGRVTRYGEAAGGVSGSTQWARLGNGTQVPFVWQVAWVRDRAGNVMRYRYAGDAVAGESVLTPADHRLVAITYGEHPDVGAATRQVTLDYVPVQSRLPQPLGAPDVGISQGYVSGMAYSRRQLLTEVAMQVRQDGAWQPVRHYRLDYETVPAALVTATPADRVRLAKLAECAPPVNGNGNIGIASCFPPTRFEWSAGAPALTPLPGFGYDGVAFYPLPPKAELASAPYERAAAQVMGDFDADGDIDTLVSPECLNDESACADARWMLWPMDAQVAAPVATNVPAWSASTWTNRAGTVLPAQNVAQRWDPEAGMLVPITPEAVVKGRLRDVKATPNAFAINYDGTYGTDVLVGELVDELAGALIDEPWGLGSHTLSRRNAASDAPTVCRDPFGTLSQADKNLCAAHPAKSEADYTGHPGFMTNLKVLSLRPGTQATFVATSLNYSAGEPILWAQPLDMNGDGLTDVMFCRANVDYSAIAGSPMPMFYDVKANGVNWVSGTLRYGLNVPGAGIDLADGGSPVGLSGATQPCHAKDAYLTLDLHGDGRESLLHYVHPSVGKTAIEATEPVVPDGPVEDPYPFKQAAATLSLYWPKLQEWNHAQQIVGEAYYEAFTYQDGGVQAQATTLPFEHFMRWQTPGNTRGRYSTHQASSPGNPDGGWDALALDMSNGRLTAWGDPGRPMTGMGPSEMRTGDINGDGLMDVLMVDFSACRYGTDGIQTDGFGQDAPAFVARVCTYQDVMEFGGSLLEQTHEQLAVQVYLNRGDGSFALGDSVGLWDTNMSSAAQAKALYQQHAGNAYELDQYAQAWTTATAATRGWRLAFGSSVMGDGNGDGLADLGLLQLSFDPDGGWVGDSMSGTYTMNPVWHLGRRSGELSPDPTPMGIDLDELVPESAKEGWPGSARTLYPNADTSWSAAGDGQVSTLTPYEQQAYGLAGRLMLMDVNQDGRDELMFFDHVRSQWRFATPEAMPQPQAELLTAVTDGLGSRTALDYAPQWSLTLPAVTWTQDDLTLAYPLVRRPSTAAAVLALHNDTGADDGQGPAYVSTYYLYGKSTSDVRHGIGLGMDRRASTRVVLTPSGPVNSLRMERYDTSTAYDAVLKAYPLAGALLSETTMVWGGPKEATAITHGGYASSAHAGVKAGTWRRQLDATTATTYEVAADAPADLADTLFDCLVTAYDGAEDCVLGDSPSHQPLSSAQTGRAYDAYGHVQGETQTSAGSTTVSERDLIHHDPAVLGGAEPYVLGLPTRQWTAHEPAPGAGYTVQTSETGYYPNGMVQSTTVEPDRPAYRHSETFTYDAVGNVSTRTVAGEGQEPATTTISYSASRAYPATVTNALGHTITTSWYEGCGVERTITTDLGHTQVNDIDTFCRATGQQGWFGSTALGRRTRITYAEWQPDAPEGYADTEIWVTTQVEGGAASHTIADRTGKVIVSQAPALGLEVYSQTRYDALGRVIATSTPTKVGQAEPSGWTQTVYDALGRVVKVSKPDGYSQVTQYERQVTRATNEVGHVGQSEVNALGQVVKVTPPADPKLPTTDLSMCYRYGAFGTLIGAGPCTPTAAKAPTTLSYDDYGRLLTSLDGQAGLRTMRYDVFGRLHESEDALGQVTRSGYDVLGRLITRTQLAGTVEATTATWVYDTLAPGLLSLSSNAEGTVTQVPLLDAFNRPVGTTMTIHGRSYTTRQSYDDWGRVASLSYPSLGVLSPVITQTQYNDLDQVIGLSYQGQTVWAPDTMDEWGHLTHQSYGNGLKARASYEPDTGRLSQSEVYREIPQDKDLIAEEPVQRFGYSWYPTGLIERRVNEALVAGQSDQFDQFHYTPRGELDRWTTVGADQQSQQRTMSYDGFGNITQSSASGTYTYEGEWLKKIDGPLGTLHYVHDGNGQVTARVHPGGTTKLGYDALNRVATITEPKASLAITYSAEGEKVHVADTVSGRETTYVGAYEEERGGDLGTAIISRYALGPVHLARTWDGKDGFTFQDTLSYLTPADHLGSTTLVTKGDGTVQDQRSYDVWGAERDPANWTAFKAAPKADLVTPNSGYTGHHERRQYGATGSGISGLIDMRTRYYDPVAGRFMAPDTLVPGIFNPLAWNRYTYVDNSPTNYSDPNGQAKENDGIDAERHIQDQMEGNAEFEAQAMGGGFSGGGGVGETGNDWAGQMLATTAAVRHHNAVEVFGAKKVKENYQWSTIDILDALRTRNSEAMKRWNYARDFAAYISGDRGATGYFKAEDFNTLDSYVTAVFESRNFTWERGTIGTSTRRTRGSSYDSDHLNRMAESDSVPGSKRALVTDEVMMLKVKLQQAADYKSVRVYTIKNSNGYGTTWRQSVLIGMPEGSANYFQESASLAALFAHEATHTMTNALDIGRHRRSRSDTARYSYHLTNQVPMANGRMGRRQYSGILRLTTEQGAAAVQDFYKMALGYTGPKFWGTFGQSNRGPRGAVDCQCSTPIEILGAHIDAAIDPYPNP